MAQRAIVARTADLVVLAGGFLTICLVLDAAYPQQVRRRILRLTDA
jgi:hypothetical protein